MSSFRSSIFSFKSTLLIFNCSKSIMCSPSANCSFSLICASSLPILFWSLIFSKRTYKQASIGISTHYHAPHTAGMYLNQLRFFLIFSCLKLFHLLSVWKYSVHYCKLLGPKNQNHSLPCIGLLVPVLVVFSQFCYAQQL